MKQPKELAFMAIAQTCHFFSYYGIKGLLILFMLERLQCGDGHAFAIAAVFAALIELGGIFGGMLADKSMGFRSVITLGAASAALGYIGLLVDGWFVPSLSLIAVGSSLFSSNVTAFLSRAYGEQDSRRQRGFTIFYMVQNMGAFASTIICGIVAEVWGFTAGFGVAAVGMLVSCCLLLARGRDLGAMGKFSFAPVAMGFIAYGALSFADVALPVLPWITGGALLFFIVQLFRDPIFPKKDVQLLALYLGALILFYAAEDQICSSLLVFTETMSDRSFLGITIPSTAIMAVNPIVIFLVGLLTFKGRRRVLFPLVVTGGAFALLACGVGISLFPVMGIVAVISGVELALGSKIYSFTSEVASRGRSGMVMGMIPLSFSIAFLGSGHLSQAVAATNYSMGFGLIALLLIGGGIILDILIRKVLREKDTADQQLSAV